MIKLTLQMKTINPTKLKKSNYKLVNYFYNLLTDMCFFFPLLDQGKRKCIITITLHSIVSEPSKTLK